MLPELFRIPFTDMTVKSYGFMMVCGFIAAIILIRRLTKNLGQNPDHITNAALYALISGVVGARIFYVVHYWAAFRDRPIEIFYVWQGGLELLGGVILAIAVIIFYMRVQKLPIRKYLDILAIALMLALSFGRVGCFLNGCCFGKPADNVPWAVRYPYASIPYDSQASPDAQRNREKAYIDLSDDYYQRFSDEAGGVHVLLRPYDELSDVQREKLDSEDKYYCKPIHPSQLYSSLSALLGSFVLYCFWRRGQKAGKSGTKANRIFNSGTTFGLLFVIYGPMRFMLERIRDDNPFEISTLTISQLLGIGLFVFGLCWMVAFSFLPSREKK